MEDRPRFNIADFFTEVMQHHLSQALARSGQELNDNPELTQQLADLLQKDPELTKTVLMISVQNRIPPPEVFTCIHTGFMMGIALVLELLNEREDYLH